MVKLRCPKCGVELYTRSDDKSLICKNCGYVSGDLKDPSISTGNEQRYIG